jgi:cell division protein FtsB
LDWSEELENACSGCEAIIPCSKIEEEIEKVEKKGKELEEERDAKQKLIDSLEEDVEFLKTITEQIET